jgi:hypothetical protein
MPLRAAAVSGFVASISTPLGKVLVQKSDERALLRRMCTVRASRSSRRRVVGDRGAFVEIALEYDGMYVALATDRRRVAQLR